MSVIEHAGYFTSLPGTYYRSQEVFDAEIARVFRTQWMYAGHVSQVPATGDFFVAQVATESLIITRDSDQRVRAFFNVCRHRGSQLCPEGSSGKQKVVVCPYHRWSWSLDGEMLGAPGSPDGVDFDYGDWPLHEANVEVLYGAIFVHLGREPIESLQDSLGERLIHEDWRALEPERAKLIHEERYAVNANWKLVLENNLECYHCAGSHPELAVSCDYEGFFVDREGTVRDSTRQTKPGHFPLRDGMKTFSMDGEWVCQKRFGTPQPEGFSASYVLAPMYTAIGWWADHAVHLFLNPVDKDTSEVVAQWFVHADAVEGADYEVDSVVAVFDATNHEDVALIEANQRGTRSDRFVPGPNSATREDALQKVLSVYLELMDAGPDDMPAANGAAQ